MSELLQSDSGYLAGFVGGLIIGLAASILLIWNGRAAGISGIYNGVLQFFKGDVAWRVYFVLGLFVGGFIIAMQAPTPEIEFTAEPFRPLAMTAIGGILVGFGTVMGAGCTSGHGVCGISRFSRRSFVAVVCFMISGIAVATAYKYIFTGGGN